MDVSLSRTSLTQRQEALLGTLRTGDLLLLGTDSAKKQSGRTWSLLAFACVGVLIRVAPGPEGLIVCHSDASPLDAACEALPAEEPLQVVTLHRLQDILQSGLYARALVRRLAQPLSRTEEALALSFVEDHYAQPMGAKACAFLPRNRPGGSLLACVGVSHNCERFWVSRLVAETLVAVGRLVPGRNSARELFPAPATFAHGRRGQVLLPPVELPFHHHTKPTLWLPLPCLATTGPRKDEQGAEDKLGVPGQAKGGRRSFGERRRHVKTLESLDPRHSSFKSAQSALSLQAD